MSKKSPKIAALIADCHGHPVFDPHYLGFFVCFNRQLYYEAHDVLEELWLAHRPGAQAKYYQGLIQMAGAFVHLQKNRLNPAARLFQLALRNFDLYPTPHEGFDLQQARNLCEQYRSFLERSNYEVNPWTPADAPQLNLL